LALSGAHYSKFQVELVVVVISIVRLGPQADGEVAEVVEVLDTAGEGFGVVSIETAADGEGFGVVGERVVEIATEVLDAGDVLQSDGEVAEGLGSFADATGIARDSV
jgi:hypothetical protein